MGNQAALLLLPRKTEGREASSASTGSPRFFHDFARMPVHACAPAPLQPKLSAGTPGDPYEREADQVANRILQMPEAQLQGACVCAGARPRREAGQADEKRRLLQTTCARATYPGNAPGSRIPDGILQSSGHALVPATRKFFEPRFGLSFAHVRIHTGADADNAARSANARAFTIGNHIAFRSGEYRPASAAGCRLLAHELTHTIQQNGGFGARSISAGGPAFQRDQYDQPPRDLEAERRRKCENPLNWSDGGHWIGTGLEPDCSPRKSKAKPKRPASRLTGFFSSKAIGKRKALAAVLKNVFSASHSKAIAGAANTQRNFKQIKSAAAATGPKGIPDNLLAGIVCIEMMNRGFWMTAEFRLTWVLSDPSLGLTQMRLSTAAMARGDIPWIESKSGSSKDRKAAAEQVEKHFEKIPDEDYLINILRSPQSSLNITAQYLAKLKNRPNRYPQQTVKQLAQNRRGMGILATEYHLGPTQTPETKAKEDIYGSQVGGFSGSKELKAVLDGY